ncbi:MAG: hypothetical protein ABJK37_22770 [Paraglaciecola sp.]|uniref:hypothetical protein n=1 Tax=Paraglaciecola sp. TaxID=1920173 RepID=UPI0032994829
MNKQKHLALIKSKAIKESKEISYRSYFKLCSNFDFHWHFHDEPKIRNSLEKKYGQIKKISQLHSEFKIIFDAFFQYFHSGESYNKPQAPKPVPQNVEINITFEEPIFEHDAYLVFCHKRQGKLGGKVWDRTTDEKGAFAIHATLDDELIAVCDGYENANACGEYCSSEQYGGWGDVVISNVAYFPCIPNGKIYF